MTENGLIAVLRDLEDSRLKLIDELNAFGTVVNEASVRLQAGDGIGALLDAESVDARDRVSRALARFSERLAATRSEAVRALVDDEGWTLTDIAKTAGKSRQLISRLYREARVRVDAETQTGM